MSRFSLFENNGAFFEAQNLAASHPDIVEQLAEPLLAWHRAVGPESPNSTDANLARGTAGCEQFAFPGMDRPQP
jgi:hypothetical protein